MQRNAIAGVGGAMMSVKKRLFSFLSYLGALNGIVLAEDGFYATGHGDETQCAYCGIKVSGWKSTDKPRERHLQANPQCHFASRQQNAESQLPRMDDVQSSLSSRAGRLDSLSSSGSIGNAVSDCVMEKHPPSHLNLNSGIDRSGKSSDRNSEHDSTSPRPSSYVQANASLSPNDKFTFQGRVNSFPSDWPKRNIVTPQELAQAGFMYVGPNDRVECAYCHGKLQNWAFGDNPFDEHKRYFGSCTFICNVSEAFGRPSLLPDRSPRRPQLKPSSSDLTLKSLPQKAPLKANSPEALGIVTDLPKRPTYALKERRLESFTGNWPENMTQTPEALADAGFYFKGPGDTVQCFHCGQSLHRWDPDDIPLSEHKRYFPTCGYLKQLASQTEIKADVPKNSSIPRVPSPSTPSQKDSIIRYLIEMGYSRRKSRKAYHLVSQKKGTEPINASDVLDQLFIMEAASDSGNASGETSEEERPSTDDELEQSDQACAADSGSDSLPVGEVSKLKDLKKENQKLKMDTFCISCKKGMADILFLPCSHIQMCDKCFKFPDIQACPKCKSKIMGVVKIFRG